MFMNTATYDQLHVRPAQLGDAADYLVEGAVAQIAQHGIDIIGVEIPASVELSVTVTEPGVQGDRVSGRASRPSWRLARPCRCRCSSTSATRSASTRGLAICQMMSPIC